MNAFTLRYEVIDSSSLDYAEYSLCPACSLRIIKLVDGCSVCGWSEEDKKLLGGLNKCSSNSSSTLKNQLAIPCTIKYPQQTEIKGVIQQDKGDRFVVYIRPLAKVY